MWQKFRDDGARPSISMSEVFSPMLEPTTLEATISECSLDVESSDIFTPKLKNRCISCCYVILIMFLPLIIFILVLEWRRMILTDNYEPLIANGTFHLAHTSCGPVEGMARDGGFEFLGIPYAIPPGKSISSDKKWKDFSYMWEPGTPAFRLEHCWKDVLKYPRKKPDECLQTRPTGDIYGQPDCLTLDIFSPFIGYDTPSPVVIVVAVPTLFGGWPDQSHKDLVTPTTGLAKDKGVVFVVPRYRLGPLGFLPRLLLNDTSSVTKNNTNFPETIIQAQKMQLKLDKSYNLGLTDLTAALMWVQTNIEHFGGDASLVTLLGWGAGADLVTTLTASKTPRGHPFLFTQAWVSHNTMATVAPPTNGTTFRAGYELWSNSPCSANQSAYDPFCLVGLPARQIVESVPRQWLTGSGHAWLEPDNFVVRQPPAAVWSKGPPPNDFPLVIGSSVHGSADTYFNCEEIESQAASDVATLLESNNETLSNLKNYKNVSDLYSKIALVSDATMTCPLWSLARKADRSFVSGVFFYVTSIEQTVSCGNGSLRLAGAISDISAIMGRYKSTDKSSAHYVSQLQDMFYEFVVDGALPGKKRASQGLYEFGEKIETRSNYPACSAWQ